jgi:hypothetical protein
MSDSLSILRQHAAILQSNNERFRNAVAATGAIERPAAGNNQCIITSINVEPDTFKDNKGQSSPVLKVTFNYETFNDPAYPEPLRFPGRPFYIRPEADVATLEPNKQQAYNIDMNRLRGHLSILLGKDRMDTPLLTLLEEAVTLLGSTTALGAAILVDVKHQYDTGKAKPGSTTPTQYYKEFLTKRIA